jgi:hypothetical protein
VDPADEEVPVRTMDPRPATGASRWTPSELYGLVAAVEPRYVGRPERERLVIGHRLWSLLVRDPHLQGKTLPAIGCALDHHDLASAVRIDEDGFAPVC